MPNEKLTEKFVIKLQTLNNALKKCGNDNPDIDTNTSYTKILEELKENFFDINYYVEEFNKKNAITKKTKGS